MNIQRVLVNNGWTIANRKQLISKIGYPQYSALVSGFERHLVSSKRALVPADSFKLHNEGDTMRLSIGINRTSEQSFLNKDICFANIQNALRTLFGINDKSHKVDFEPSKTMEKLFTPEFKPSKHINEDGYYVTTIMDKVTGEPVEAYAKQVKSSHVYSLSFLDDTVKPKEQWEIYVKDSSLPSGYRRIGKNNFKVNYDRNKIEYGYMDSTDGNERYGGIGIRLHQIAVERMLQERLKTLQLEALPSAFPFHYKCGFRIPHWDNCYFASQLEVYLETWAELSGKPVDELRNAVVKGQDERYYIVNPKAVEEIKKEICIKTNGEQDFEDTNMTLQGKYLKDWVAKVKSQPIILEK